MEIREFAERILDAESVEGKLVPVEVPVSDELSGVGKRYVLPARPVELKFAGPKEAPPMPSAAALFEPGKRAIAHHIMANHELQALEVMAFVLCAFPDAPAEFRRGMLPIMADEQRHTRMHVERLEALGLRFGALPVNGYFWKKAQDFECVLDYLAGLPLTFEACNLDHTLEFEEMFLAAGDEKSAAIMRTIHNDEIRHVAFGLHWLRELKSPDADDWQAYCEHLKWPLRPFKSKGKTFHRAPRTAAGMSDEFLDHLEQHEDV